MQCDTLIKMIHHMIIEPSDAKRVPMAYFGQIEIRTEGKSIGFYASPPKNGLKNPNPS